MRNCDHSNCWQGRMCQVERDTPRAAAFAVIASVIALAAPFALWMMGFPK